MKFVVPSPCKLNLFLHITGQRDDGYHTLQTVFQLLDYSDELVFETLTEPEKSADGEACEISVRGMPDVELGNNLVYKAALAMQARSQWPKSVCITINKRIPIGGGLGGGSSNAATTLLVLNKIWK